MKLLEGIYSLFEKHKLNRVRLEAYVDSQELANIKHDDLAKVYLLVVQRYICIQLQHKVKDDGELLLCIGLVNANNSDVDSWLGVMDDVVLPVLTSTDKL